MPSATTTTTVLTVVGALAFVVGVVGSVALGWRFGGGTDTTRLALELGCVAFAVGSSVRGL